MVLCGYARTGQYIGLAEYDPGEDPYELEIALVDDLAAGDVAVLGCFQLPKVVPWGELLTTASLARGAVGCLTDGLARDSRQICQLGFPVFSAGLCPLDTRGRGKMISMDRAVTIANVKVRSGDLVFGDCDGVLIIPADIATDVLTNALKKVRTENAFREELKQGAKLRDVYAKHGIL
jgi:regulator of RNase E activity RraA